MTSATTDDLIARWSTDRKTPDLLPDRETPDLLTAFEPTIVAVRWRDLTTEWRDLTTETGGDKPASVDEFLAWLDSEDFERDAHTRIREQAWRG